MRAHYGDTQPQINLTVDTTATTGEREKRLQLSITLKSATILQFTKEKWIIISFAPTQILNSSTCLKTNIFSYSLKVNTFS